MLRWSPDSFWRSNAWELMHAWDGYAAAKGIKKPKPKIPSEADRKALRARVEREAKYG